MVSQHLSRLFCFLVSFNLALTQSFCQQHDYPAIFGDDWKKAESFIEENISWLTRTFSRYDIDSREAIAVIFPELVRYSALRDKVEITLLKALYVNLGKEYANFSIGQYQMKPEFAEKIRQMAGELPSVRLRNIVSDSTGYRNIRSYRASIVSDLEDIRAQTRYLILFIKLCYMNFDLGTMDETGRVRFLAAAYNGGFDKGKDEIMAKAGKHFFSTKLFGNDFYSYTDISLCWYSQNQSVK